MPQSQADVILDSITLDNIDDAMYFYSHILEKIVEKKKKFQHNEERSEEHTSELQSRLRISYAVFCLDRKSVV